MSDDHAGLIGLLDLDGRAAGPTPAGPGVLSPGNTGPPAPPSPHCLEHDRWGAGYGDRLVSDNPGSAFARLGPAAAADCFGLAFQPDPAFRDAPADPALANYLREVTRTADYASLHADSQNDVLVSELAADSYAQGYERLRREQQQKREEAERAARRGRPGPGKPGGAGRPAPASGAKPGGSPGPDPAVTVAAAKAARAARREADDAAEVLAALGGAGAGPGGPASRLDAEAAARVFRRVRNDPSLKRVVDLAGAFRRLMAGRRRRHSPDARTETRGVTPVRDPLLLLPASLARLALPDPALRARGLADLLGGRLLGWERAGAEPAGLGPVLVTVDQSGSMHGRKSEEAKGLALAIAFAARRKNRWCALVSYSGTGNGEEDVLVLPPGRPWDPARVCDWVARFLGKGNMCDVPVRELPGYYDRLGAPPGRTDVLMVTDDQLRMPDDWIPPFLAWKKRAKVRATGLVVGGGGGGQLALLVDDLVRAAALTPDGEAAARVADSFL